MTAESATSPTPVGPPSPARAAAATDDLVARAHRSLLPLALGLIAANLVLHLVIALAGNRITVLTTLPLVVIALGVAAYLATRGRALGRLRYGRLVAHVLCFLTVTAGYQLHLTVLAVLGAAPPSDGTLDPWLGPALVMPALWGLGLLMHAVGAVLDRGFEAPRA
ncbi:hypothetical protein [Brachybacterium aquaticum]|uniref:Uncharacterized protein n=1 Tax=Brachybacterium aquaticum TaxID=1432564 RepID=A0A841AGG4_9MICO|nr:hypothetical protein [Brachybacterium aquaticum]MBB5832691.1 hypothetical protein [Brachybacterium aquaticum]